MQVTRRQVLKATAVVGIAPVFGELTKRPVFAGDPGPLPIVVDGEARSVVVVAPDADDQTSHAVDVLVSHVERATGATLPVSDTPPDDGRTAVYVGSLPADSDLPDSELEDLPDDGYVIYRQGTTISILGPSAWGTRFGVYEFLEKYVDVRWLMPDSLPAFPDLVGSDVPETPTIAVPEPNLVTGEPVFGHRVLNPFPAIGFPALAWDHLHPSLPAIASMQETWGRPARVRGRIWYAHNMWRVISPTKYGNPSRPETYHPEFFPIRGGETFIPPAGQQVGWQPRFSAPGIAEVAAQEVLDFADRRGLSTVSLAINDNGGFSEDEVETGVLNHFGFLDASPVYYPFVREVAEIVADARPDLTIAILAYREVTDPPDEPLPPNVVTLLTSTVHAWLDPVEWARDDVWLQAWRQVSTQLGWWDYTYQWPHSLPRLYLQHTADAYRYLRDNDVTELHIGTRVSWGEGPKTWILSRLAWDPDQSVHRLLMEWCQRCVGRTAAPYLAAYFKHWDKFWTERIRDSEWFETPLRYRFNPNSATYLDLVDEKEIARSRLLLEMAQARTETAEQQRRLDMLMTHFEYYEASALSYPKRTTLPGDSSDASVLLDSTVSSLDRNIAFAADRLEMADQLQEGMRDLGPRRFNLAWTGWNLYAAWDIAQFIRENEPDGGTVRSEVESLLNDESANVQAFAELVLAIADGQTEGLGENLSFEDSTLAPWNAPAGSGIAPDTEHVLDGDQSMRIPGGFAGAVTQLVNAKPGFFRFAAHIFAPPGLDDDDTVENPAPRRPYGYRFSLRVRALDDNGALLKTIQQHFSVKRAAGTWYEVVLAELLPDNTAEAEYWLISEANAPVWVDDVSIVQESQ